MLLRTRTRRQTGGSVPSSTTFRQWTLAWADDREVDMAVTVAVMASHGADRAAADWTGPHLPANQLARSHRFERLEDRRLSFDRRSTRGAVWRRWTAWVRPFRTARSRDGPEVHAVRALHDQGCGDKVDAYGAEEVPTPEPRPAPYQGEASIDRDAILARRRSRATGPPVRDPASRQHAPVSVDGDGEGEGPCPGPQRRGHFLGGNRAASRAGGLHR